MVFEPAFDDECRFGEGGLINLNEEQYAALSAPQEPPAAEADVMILYLYALVGLAEAVVTPFVEGFLHEDVTGKNFCLQLSAAAAEAAHFAAVSPGVMSNPVKRDVIPFLLGVLTVYKILESIHGVGNPDVGGDFSAGSTIFLSDVNSILYDACPDPDKWYGSAAEKYADLNDKLRNLANQLAEADQEIAHRLARQAFYIDWASEALADCQNIIFTASGVMVGLAEVWRICMESPPPEGELAAISIAELARRLALTFSIFTVPVAMGWIGDLGNTISRHSKKKFRHVKSTYKLVAEQAASILAEVNFSGAAIELCDTTWDATRVGRGSQGSYAVDRMERQMRPLPRGAGGLGQRARWPAVFADACVAEKSATLAARPAAGSIAADGAVFAEPRSVQTVIGVTVDDPAACGRRSW